MCLCLVKGRKVGVWTLQGLGAKASGCWVDTPLHSMDNFKMTSVFEPVSSFFCSAKYFGFYFVSLSTLYSRSKSILLPMDGLMMTYVDFLVWLKIHVMKYMSKKLRSEEERSKSALVISRGLITSLITR